MGKIPFDFAEHFRNITDGQNRVFAMNESHGFEGLRGDPAFDKLDHMDLGRSPYRELCGIYRSSVRSRIAVLKDSIVMRTINQEKYDHIVGVDSKTLISDLTRECEKSRPLHK